jgi:thiosulfate reductase cytochrome b subunit
MPTESTPPISHSHTVRVTHWITTASFIALVVSGVVITMTHPRLYWGNVGNPDTPALLVLPIQQRLGHSGWGRSLHFLAGWILVLNGFVYVVSSFARRHFQRAMIPTEHELRLASVGEDLRSHIRGEVRKVHMGPHYGVLQKLTYLAVIFLLVPFIIGSGLTMSPAVTAAYPVLFSIFGGHQTARTLHFFASSALLLFVVVHVVMVIKTGFKRQLRSITPGVKTP